MNELPGFRPPAVPLIVLDPYFSIWSFADRLAGETTRHWTGTPLPMAGAVRIDGKYYTLCGQLSAGALTPEPMHQSSLEVLPTRTIYRFEQGGVALGITFLTPSIPQDLDLLGSPFGYLIFDAVSVDGRPHEVSLYWEVSGQIAANGSSDPLCWERKVVPGADTLSIASAGQSVLQRAGDDLRIEWGQAFLSQAAGAGEMFLGDRQLARDAFFSSGGLPAEDEMYQPRVAACQCPSMVSVLHFGDVAASARQRYLVLAYDDVFSIEYFHRKLRPWWRRNGETEHGMIRRAHESFAAICSRCADYDQHMMAQFAAAGGAEYARICALAFRQCLGAHKLAADIDNAPLYFSKENFSNGCIATVDVTYPSAPFFLAFNPDLLQAQLDPVFTYASLPRWKFPFAPHDLGTYPLANGQVYGGGEISEQDQMPVEECGNMLILAAALCLKTGRREYARKWWSLLSTWAEYLEHKGLDPENQLCTDDFAGHLARNTNLSLKAIVALGSYAKLAALIGEAGTAARFSAVAKTMAKQWQEMADEGTHYRLTFDRKESWSQKYNLIWNRLLGLELFPAQVAQTEVAFYRGKMNAFGLPLDSRQTYTKLDWIFWTASLTGCAEDFAALTAPVYHWVNAGASRVPLTDWFETVGDGRKVGFQARSVVGGIFIRLLDEPAQGSRALAPDSVEVSAEAEAAPLVADDPVASPV